MAKRTARVKQNRDRESALAVRLAEVEKLAHLGSWEWDVPANQVTWSDELYRIYGLTPGEFGATFEAYLERVHPEDRDHARATVETAYRTGQPFDFEERIVRPDGTKRLLHSRGQVVLDEAGACIRMLGVCYDITEQRRAEERSRGILLEQAARVGEAWEERLERTLQQLEKATLALRRSNEALVAKRQEAERAEAAASQALAELQRAGQIVQAVLRRATLDAMLDELLSQVREALGSDEATILLLDREGTHLLVRASQGIEPDDLSAVRVPVGRGVAGLVVATRQPLVVNNTSQVEIFGPHLRSSVKSLLAVPLLLEERVLGALHVGTAARRVFLDEDRDFLQLVVQQVAPLVERAWLAQERLAPPAD